MARWVVAMGASEEEEMQAMGLVVAVVVVAASVLEAMQGMGVEGGEGATVATEGS